MTEEVIRILRKADGEQAVEEVCRDAKPAAGGRTDLPPMEAEVRPHGDGGRETLQGTRGGTGRSGTARPKVCPEGGAKRRQNSELKKMGSDEILKNRVMDETPQKKW